MSDVLAEIRAALGVRGDEAERRRAVAERLACPPDHPVPARVRKPHQALVADFIARLTANRASVERVPDLAGAPAAIARRLQAQNLPARLAAAPSLHALDLAPIEAEFRTPRARDEVGLSRADFGIAETGTLALFSGPDDPATLAFVPENHIVLLDEAAIVGPFEAVWQAQRERFPDLPPRALCFLSGPSRTADIEQTLELGAHGPKRLHVILHGAG